jgi:hypothetical protein
LAKWKKQTQSCQACVVCEGVAGLIKPKQTQSTKGPNECKLPYNKGLQKKRLFSRPKNKPNSNPISSKAKMNANVFITKDYENETALRPQKNKPNSNPNKACPERSRMGQFQTQSSLAQTMLFAILERRVVMTHLGRYWQTKPKVSDKLLRKVVEKC